MNAATFSLLLFCGSPLPAAQTDYLIRVERIGYVDAVVTENGPEPQEGPLQTLETICRLNEPFLARIVVGPATTSISGVLRRAEDPDEGFVVEFDCSHVVDSGKSVPVAPGVEEKILDITSSHGAVAIRESVPFEQGGITSRSTDFVAGWPAPRTQMSKLTVRVTVERYRTGED